MYQCLCKCAMRDERCELPSACLAHHQSAPLWGQPTQDIKPQERLLAVWCMLSLSFFREQSQAADRALLYFSIVQCRFLRNHGFLCMSSSIGKLRTKPVAPTLELLWTTWGRYPQGDFWQNIGPMSDYAIIILCIIIIICRLYLTFSHVTSGNLWPSVSRVPVILRLDDDNDADARHGWPSVNCISNWWKRWNLIK